MANKVQFGLRNVYYSKITLGADNDYTYATPVAINGAVSLSLSPNGSKSDFYADDSVFYSVAPNQGYTGSLNIAMLTDDFKKDILGMQTDTNGALVENADDIMSPFALAFEVQGDVAGRRTWLYHCTCERAETNAETKQDSVSPQTDTLNISIVPRLSDKAVKVTLEKTTTSETAYNSFFTAVYEKK